MRSILLYVLILISYVFIQFLPLEWISEHYGLSRFESGQLSEIVNNLITVSLAIVVINKLKLTQLAGIDKKSSWSKWYLLLIPSYLIFIGLIQIKNLDFTEIQITSLIILFFSTMSIGLSEELVFRGLLQSILIKRFLRESGKRALLLSVLISSFVFGLLHLLDFKAENASSEISQVLYSTFIGVAFGAILLRTNKLYILALIHGLIDFVFNIDELPIIMEPKSEVASSIISEVFTIVLVSPLLITGLSIIKKIEVSSILRKIEASSK